MELTREDESKSKNGLQIVWQQIHITRDLQPTTPNRRFSQGQTKRYHCFGALQLLYKARTRTSPKEARFCGVRGPKTLSGSYLPLPAVGMHTLTVACNRHSHIFQRLIRAPTHTGHGGTERAEMLCVCVFREDCAVLCVVWTAGLSWGKLMLCAFIEA
jgi:hypothetical protein